MIRIELCKAELVKLVAYEISRHTGCTIDPKNIRIEVKSTQDYRAEWEPAMFRAVYEATWDNHKS